MNPAIASATALLFGPGALLSPTRHYPKTPTPPTAADLSALDAAKAKRQARALKRMKGARA